MSFDNNDFVDLLNFYKGLSNFLPNAKSAFETFTEVSKSDSRDYSLIIDENKLFNLDNMCWNCHIKSNGFVKSNLPSSVDGIHFKNGKLFLIEFKGTSIYLKDSDDIFNKSIVNLKNNNADHDLINALNDLKIRYEDEILCQLKIKPWILYF